MMGNAALNAPRMFPLLNITGDYTRIFPGYEIKHLLAKTDAMSERLNME